MFKLQLDDAIYRLRFYSNSFIHILSLSNSHNNVASIQKNQDDKSHRVIVAIVKATSHSTIFDIPMRPLCENQKTPASFHPLKKACNSRDGDYSFEFCTLPTHRNR